MPRKPTLLATVGLPASGKTTWAKQYQTEHPGTVLVSKDDLRAMLHANKHSTGREHFVLKIRDAIIRQALNDGHDCIVCDTNFHDKHRERFAELAAQHGAILEIKDFTDVPLETCIARDLQRANSVGERVIRQMHRQYIEPKVAKPVYDPAMRDAVICDLDGTLALFGDANPYDRDFSKDEVNESVKAALLRFGIQTRFIFLSGRKEKHREQTIQWCLRNNIGVITTLLYMRRNDDNRPDYIVKEEMYNEHIKDRYNVVAVFDDRLSVCRLWYRLGLPLFRVGDPDADF